MYLHFGGFCCCIETAKKLMTSIRPVIVFIPISREPVYMMLSSCNELYKRKYLGVVSNETEIRVGKIGVGISTNEIIML